MPYSFVAIKPDKFNSSAIFQELDDRAHDVADLMLKDYLAGVANWNHKVTFKKDVTVNPFGGVGIQIDTEDEVYTFVHEGTRAHRIEPRRARRLAYPSGYRAKTKPGQIKSTPGGSFGETRFSSGVNHPGFPGRFFSRPIQAKWDPFFRREMQRALDEGAERSGHSI